MDAAFFLHPYCSDYNRFQSTFKWIDGLMKNLQIKRIQSEEFIMNQHPHTNTEMFENNSI